MIWPRNRGSTASMICCKSQNMAAATTCTWFGSIICERAIGTQQSGINLKPIEGLETEDMAYNETGDDRSLYSLLLPIVAGAMVVLCAETLAQRFHEHH